MTSKTLSKPHSDLVTSAAFDPASKVSLGETIRDFIRDYRAREAAKATLYRYEHYLDDYKSWLELEGLPADMASLQGKRGVKHIQGYLAYMRRDKAAAPGTIATAFRVLKTFWNWAVRESLDEDNEPSIPPFVKRSPMDFLAKTETPRDVVADDVGEPFSDEEVSRILAEIGPPNSRSLEVLRNRAMVHTLLASGVRRKELTGLLISDYNPDHGYITVRRSAAKQTRRRDDSRLTTLYGVAQKEVNNYVRRLRMEGKVNGPLFPSLRGGQTEHRGHHLRPDSVTQILDRIVKNIQAKCPREVGAFRPMCSASIELGCADAGACDGATPSRV
jgi:site-specific recombinase XerD